MINRCHSTQYEIKFPFSDDAESNLEITESTLTTVITTDILFALGEFVVK